MILQKNTNTPDDAGKNHLISKEDTASFLDQCFKPSSRNYAPQIDEKIVQEFNKTLKNFYKQANDGDSQAQLFLGIHYYRKQNYTDAVDWFQKSANQNNDSALYLLGMCYKNGDGAKLNLKKAFKCFKKAGDLGHEEAQYRLANCYRLGLGTQKNFNKAFEYYLKSANQGCPISQYSVGVCYAHGIGTEKNIKEAIKWYEEAEKNGFQKAKEVLIKYNKKN